MAGKNIATFLRLLHAIAKEPLLFIKRIRKRRLISFSIVLCIYGNATQCKTHNDRWRQAFIRNWDITVATSQTTVHTKNIPGPRYIKFSHKHTINDHRKFTSPQA